MSAQADPLAYGRALSGIIDHADDLSGWLAIWTRRSEPDARARRAASNAMGAVDAMAASLHGIRARLLTEIRAADEASAARADALLSDLNGGGTHRRAEAQRQLDRLLAALHDGRDGGAW